MVSDTFGDIAADFTRATGSVTVTGTGSTWTNSSDLYIGGRRICCTGSGNNGTLLIDAGATVTSVNAFIGFTSNSTGAVTFRSEWFPILLVTLQRILRAQQVA